MRRASLRRLDRREPRLQAVQSVVVLAVAIACAAWILAGVRDLDRATERRRLGLARFQALRAADRLDAGMLAGADLHDVFPGLEPVVVSSEPGPRIVLRRRAFVEAER